MSLFLDPEGEAVSIDDEHNYSLSYPSTPSSHVTQGGPDLFDAGNAWANVCADEAYRASQSAVWPSQIGLNLPSAQTSTQSMLVDPGLATFNPVVPAPWASSMGILMPLSTYRETRHDSLLQNCYPQSAFLPPQAATAWDAPGCGVASFRPSCEMSPGESDYSMASRTAGLPSSSTYAHPEVYYPRRSSPIIKIEQDNSRVAPRMRSASNSTSPRAQDSHVNPGDIYNPHEFEVSQQPTTPPLAPVKVEEHSKPVLRPRPAGQQSIAEEEDMRRATTEDRRKRGYTTPVNAVCSCDECGKLFQRTSNLRAHMDTHRPDREQPWACQFYGCGRRFVRKTDMTRHQESVHIKSRKFQCMLCYGSFARKDTLRRHIDDGCPRRMEYRELLKRDHSPSSSRISSHQYGDYPGDFVVPKEEMVE